MSKPSTSKGDQTARSKKTKACAKPTYILPKKHKEELYEIFEMLDDGSGYIKVKDVQEALKSMNFIPDEAEMKRLFKGIKSDKITADNLVTIMENKISEDETKTDLQRIFNCFDYDNKGFITHGNLKKLAKDLEVEITDEDIKEMIEEADLDNNGVINEEEFIKIMLQTDI